MCSDRDVVRGGKVKPMERSEELAPEGDRWLVSPGPAATTGHHFRQQSNQTRSAIKSWSTISSAKDPRTPCVKWLITGSSDTPLCSFGIRRTTSRTVIRALSYSIFEWEVSLIGSVSIEASNNQAGATIKNDSLGVHRTALTWIAGCIKYWAVRLSSRKLSKNRVGGGKLWSERWTYMSNIDDNSFEPRTLCNR